MQSILLFFGISYMKNATAQETNEQDRQALLFSLLDFGLGLGSLDA